MEYLAVLNHFDDSLNVYSLTEEQSQKEPEELLKELEFDSDDCSWFFGNNLNLQLNL